MGFHCLSVDFAFVGKLIIVNGLDVHVQYNTFLEGLFNLYSVCLISEGPCTQVRMRKKKLTLCSTLFAVC